MITIYTIKGCSLCEELKRLLKKFNVKYEEKDASIASNLSDLYLMNICEIPVVVYPNGILSGTLAINKILEIVKYA